MAKMTQKEIDKLWKEQAQFSEDERAVGWLVVFNYCLSIGMDTESEDLTGIGMVLNFIKSLKEKSNGRIKS